MTADTSAVVKRSRGVAAQLATGVGFLLKKNKVDVIWGEATIAKPARSPSSHQDVGAAADRAAQGRARARHLSGQAHHRRDRRAAARRCPASSPTRS